MKKLILGTLIVAFLLQTVAPQMAVAQEFALPKPGTLVRLSAVAIPPVLKGIKVHVDDPMRLEFLMDKGASTAPDQAEVRKLVKYFLAAITTPERDLWVNLSPYERDRIVPEGFGQTEMGRDLLAQDYLLKQLTASLIYPDDPIGQQFWKKVYSAATLQNGQSKLPVNTFNKVWIMPDRAVVYENAARGSAYVVTSSLKVMLEEDYLALAANTSKPAAPASQIIRDIVIPALTKEVNEGTHFAVLRQVYHSLILATWYKKKIKDALLLKVYADRNKVAGVNIDDPQEKQRIYERYLRAFKQGVYNMIKEETDPTTHQPVARKYFSGGVTINPAKNLAMTAIVPQEPAGQPLVHVDVRINPYGSKDAAMISPRAAIDRVKARFTAPSPAAAVDQLIRQVTQDERQYMEGIIRMVGQSSVRRVLGQAQENDRIFSHILDRLQPYARGAGEEAKVIEQYRKVMRDEHAKVERAVAMYVDVLWPRQLPKGQQYQAYHRRAKEALSALQAGDRTLSELLDQAAEPQAEDQERRRVMMALERHLRRHLEATVSAVARFAEDRFKVELYKSVVMTPGDNPRLASGIEGFLRSHNEALAGRVDVPGDWSTAEAMAKGAVTPSQWGQVRSKLSSRFGTFVVQRQQRASVRRGLSAAIVLSIMAGLWSDALVTRRNPTAKVANTGNAAPGTSKQNSVPSSAITDAEIRQLLQPATIAIPPEQKAPVPAAQAKVQADEMRTMEARLKAIAEEQRTIKKEGEQSERELAAAEAVKIALAKDPQLQSSIERLNKAAEKYQSAVNMTAKTAPSSNWNESPPTGQGQALSPEASWLADAVAEHMSPWLASRIASIFKSMGYVPRMPATPARGAVSQGASFNELKDMMANSPILETRGKFRYMVGAAYTRFDPITGRYFPTKYTPEPFELSKELSGEYFVQKSLGQKAFTVLVPLGYEVVDIRTKNPVELQGLWRDVANRHVHIAFGADPEQVKFFVKPDPDSANKPLPAMEFVDSRGKPRSRTATDALLQRDMPPELWAFFARHRQDAVEDRKRLREWLVGRPWFAYTTNEQLGANFTEQSTLVQSLFRYMAGKCDGFSSLFMLYSYLLNLNDASIQIGYVGNGDVPHMWNGFGAQEIADSVVTAGWISPFYLRDASSADNQAEKEFLEKEWAPRTRVLMAQDLKEADQMLAGVFKARSKQERLQREQQRLREELEAKQEQQMAASQPQTSARSAAYLSLLGAYADRLSAYKVQLDESSPQARRNRMEAIKKQLVSLPLEGVTDQLQYMALAHFYNAVAALLADQHDVDAQFTNAVFDRLWDFARQRGWDPDQMQEPIFDRRIDNQFVQRYNVAGTQEKPFLMDLLTGTQRSLQGRERMISEKGRAIQIIGNGNDYVLFPEVMS